MKIAKTIKYKKRSELRVIQISVQKWVDEFSKTLFPKLSKIYNHEMNKKPDEFANTFFPTIDETTCLINQGEVK